VGIGPLGNRAEQSSFRAVSEVPRDVQRRQQLEGKKVEVDEILPAARAYPVIEQALAAYDKKRRAGHHGK
jgi:hypothetical protein